MHSEDPYWRKRDVERLLFTLDQLDDEYVESLADTLENKCRKSLPESRKPDVDRITTALSSLGINDRDVTRIADRVENLVRKSNKRNLGPSRMVVKFPRRTRKVAKGKSV